MHRFVLAQVLGQSGLQANTVRVLPPRFCDSLGSVSLYPLADSHGFKEAAPSRPWDKLLIIHTQREKDGWNESPSHPSD